MKIVVIGGSGLIGKKLVGNLRRAGHEAVAASPSSGVNTLTGEGLAGALAGAEVVVDVSNSPSFADAAVLEFFETSTRNLLAAEAAAGVRHHVALSVVGADRLPDSGYMRAKVAQERSDRGRRRAVHDRPGHAVLRVPGRNRRVGRGRRARCGCRRPRCNRIAADDVAAALADVAVGTPLNDTIELAGPRGTAHRRVRGAVPGRERGHSERWSRTQSPLLRRDTGRPRARTRGKSPSRFDTVRELARPHRSIVDTCGVGVR